MDAWISGNAPDSVKFRVLVLHAHKIHAAQPYAALTYAREAYRIAAERNDNRIPVAALTLGRVYIVTKDYTKALAFLQEALNRADSASRKNNRMHKGFRAEVCMNLGQVYSHLMQYDKSYLYYHEALNESSIHKLNTIEGTVLLNAGTMFMNSRQNDSAFSYFKRALYRGEADTNSVLTGAALINLASLYNDLGRTGEAEFYARKMLDSKMGTDQRQVAYCYNVLGEINIKKSRWKEAEKYLLASLEAAYQLADKELILNLLKDLSRVNEKTNRPAEALAYSRKAYELNDSTYRQNLAQQLAEMQVKFETDRKDKQFEKLRHEKELMDVQLDKAGLIRNVIIAAMFLAMAVSGILIIHARARQRLNMKLEAVNKKLLHTNSLLEENNVQLAQKNGQISHQKKEIESINKALSNYNNKLIDENILAKYEVLKSKVNPHFLFNSLSTLSSLVTESETLALEYIARFSDLYRMILETSETKLLTLGEEKRIVEGYLYLQQMEYEGKLDVSICIPQWAEAFLLPPFSVQMAVENAIKHNIVTSKNKLRLAITVEGKELVVTNNLQPKTSRPHSTQTGQKNILGRYSLVSREVPRFIQSLSRYSVFLPLIEPEKTASCEVASATVKHL